MNPVNVGLIGLGTVGAGVARLLLEHPDRIARRAGRPIRLAGIAVRDLIKPRNIAQGTVPLTPEPQRLINDPTIEVIIEAMGGVEPALDYVLKALTAGKHVVTANKALLAEHGGEIFAQARAAGARSPSREARGRHPDRPGDRFCAGRQSSPEPGGYTQRHLQFHSDQDDRRWMCRTTKRSCKLSGWASPRPIPTLDVDGTDTAHKLAILAQLAFETDIRLDSIPRQGIDHLHLADLRYAGELGYAIKLLALAKLSAAGLELRVAPTLVKRGTPLAEVRGPYNAIRVVGDAVGDTLFYGRGAGAMPTASAVVGDVIDVVTGPGGTAITISRPGCRSRPLSVPFAPAEKIKSRYYLRFTIADRPGVLAKLAQILGDQGISIASVIQHDPGDDAPDQSPVPLVIMTHLAIQADLYAALSEIDRLDAVHASSVCLGVED